MPDKLFIKINYHRIFGKELDLKNPITYNEKLQWIKLYDRNNLYTKLVDKIEAKKRVADRIGEKYIIPLLGVYSCFDEIDFDKLPNQFVLKCNHDSGSVVVCKDKQKFDYVSARNILEKGLRRNFYLQSREWPYKNIQPLIFAEQYLFDNSEGNFQVLVDYKFFCFNGLPQIMYIGADKAKSPTSDFFDMDFNHLPIRMVDPNADSQPTKPECFEQMKELARILSKDIPHVRIDFYYVNGKIYFGEYTFFHMGGFTPVLPYEWNVKMGEMIHLPI